MSLKSTQTEELGQKLKIKLNFVKKLECETPTELSAIIKEEALINPCLVIEEAVDEQEIDSDLNEDTPLPLDDEIETNPDFYLDEELEEDLPEEPYFKALLIDQEPFDAVEDLFDPEKPSDLKMLTRIAEAQSNNEGFNEVLKEYFGQNLSESRDIEPFISIRYNSGEKETKVYDLPDIGGLFLNDELKNVMKENYNNAFDLVNVIVFHRNKLNDIADIIADRQREFFVAPDFKSAIKSLTLLTQEEISKALNVHKSTVHRLVKGKFVDTKFGYIPLQLFFTSRSHREKTKGDVVSAAKIEMLKEIIASKDDVPTDKEIQAIFKESGVNISLEMIRYYRKKLGIKKNRGRKKK